jgi:hypothetical protein
MSYRYELYKDKVIEYSGDESKKWGLNLLRNTINMNVNTSSLELKQLKESVIRSRKWIMENYPELLL